MYDDGVGDAALDLGDYIVAKEGRECWKSNWIKKETVHKGFNSKGVNSR